MFQILKIQQAFRMLLKKIPKDLKLNKLLLVAQRFEIDQL